MLPAPIDIARVVTPYVERSVSHRMSFGQSLLGYDIRLGADVIVYPNSTVLGVSLEHFDMPCDMFARVWNKSTWARLGLDAARSTVIEPGWRGYLTLELVWTPLRGDIRPSMPIERGTPIAQVMFEWVGRATRGYGGKYQDQAAEPVAARWEPGE